MHALKERVAQEYLSASRLLQVVLLLKTKAVLSPSKAVILENDLDC